MQVEINLLPRSSEKNITLRRVLVAFLLLSLLVIAVIHFWGKFYETKLEAVDKQLASAQSLILAEEEKVKENDAVDSVTTLQQAVSWADDYPIDTVKLMQQLISLLPERGFIQFFSFSEDELLLKVQFDTNRDSAYYLNSLTEADWIVDAQLVKLAADASGSDSVEDKEADELLNAEFVPRYLAEYEITINRSKVKRNSVVAKVQEVAEGERDE